MRVAALLASAALIASPAYAQINNNQVRLDDSWSQLRLRVDEAVDVGGTSIAGGNAATVTAQDSPVELNSTQQADGAATAEAEASVNTAHGNVSIYSAAVNNGLTAIGENSDISASSAQFSSGDVTADTRTQIGNAWSAASSASAGGNVASLVTENGDLTAVLHQDSASTVTANVEADHCCVSTDAVGAAIASANNVTLTGTTTTLLSATSQISTGDAVTARVDLYAGYAGTAIGNATANGNALNVDNAFGYVNTAATQANTSDVGAQSFVTLGGDWLGTGSAGAYGVGNSAIVSNAGSDTDMNIAQENYGAVSADAAVAGAGGEYALASSAAYGNVITGSLCGYCDASQPGLNASGSQRNEGNVSASAVINTPYARTVAGTATAIGNTASYNVSGRN